MDKEAGEDFSASFILRFLCNYSQMAVVLELLLLVVAGWQGSGGLPHAKVALEHLKSSMPLQGCRAHEFQPGRVSLSALHKLA